jgi:hypothetical protein
MSYSLSSNRLRIGFHSIHPPDQIEAVYKKNRTYTTKIQQLTPKHCQYRVHWTESISNSGLLEMPWLFTDEMSIQTNPNRHSVLRLPGIALDSYCEEFEGYPTKIMVWGGISLNYKSPLMKIDGMIDQYKYQQMLQESGVFKDMNQLYGPGGWLFMDDGAPSHRDFVKEMKQEQRLQNRKSRTR